MRTLLALLCLPALALAAPPVRVIPTQRPPGQLDDLVERVATRRGYPVQVTAHERTGHLVVTGDRRGQRVVERLVRRLDRPRRAPRVTIHRLQHTPAKDIEAVLRALRRQ